MNRTKESKLSDFEILQFVGRGKSGNSEGLSSKVYEVVHKKTKRNFSLKKISKRFIKEEKYI